MQWLNVSHSEWFNQRASEADTCFKGGSRQSSGEWQVTGDKQEKSSQMFNRIVEEVVRLRQPGTANGVAMGK